MTTHTISIQPNDGNNPVGKLQEMHIVGDGNCGFPPQYDIIETEGEDHEPTFTMKVTFRGQSAIGRGSSKKIAKTIAATNLLSKLLGDEKVNSTISLKIEEVSTTGNTVGDLQEFCCTKGLYHPWYEEVSALGPAHNKNFALTCSIGGILSERGSGPNKKTAKRESAGKVLVKLKSMSPDELRQLEDPELKERLRKREEELLRQEEEEKETQGEETGESTMGTWGEDEGERQTWSQQQKPEENGGNSDSAKEEIGGWGSGQAMHDGEMGVWGTGEDSQLQNTEEALSKVNLKEK